jgi:hypothetical protein
VDVIGDIKVFLVSFNFKYFRPINRPCLHILQLPKTVTVIRVCAYTRRHDCIWCKFDIVAKYMYYFNFLHENTIFYYIKTKQSSYYFFFFMKVFTFVSMLAYTSGFKCQRPNILGALKSDSTHHFLRNACTKWGSLRFSQFSSCWLICLSIYLWVLTFPL